MPLRGYLNAADHGAPVGVTCTDPRKVAIAELGPVEDPPHADPNSTASSAVARNSRSRRLGCMRQSLSLCRIPGNRRIP